MAETPSLHSLSLQDPVEQMATARRNPHDTEIATKTDARGQTAGRASARQTGHGAIVAERACSRRGWGPLQRGRRGGAPAVAAPGDAGGGWRPTHPTASVQASPPQSPPLSLRGGPRRPAQSPPPRPPLSRPRVVVARERARLSRGGGVRAPRLLPHPIAAGRAARSPHACALPAPAREPPRLGP